NVPRLVCEPAHRTNDLHNLLSETVVAMKVRDLRALMEVLRNGPERDADRSLVYLDGPRIVRGVEQSLSCQLIKEPFRVLLLAKKLKTATNVLVAFLHEANERLLVLAQVSHSADLPFRQVPAAPQASRLELSARIPRVRRQVDRTPC